MYFTLAVSAATAEGCAALAGAACDADPRIMPLPGAPGVAWRAPDGRAAVLYWPGGATPRNPPLPPCSHAGTIWADPGGPEPATVCARTGLARVDPVYLAETSAAVVLSDRACWAAAAAGRLTDHDPVMVGAFLSLGYPVGAATPFRGVRAVGCSARPRPRRTWPAWRRRPRRWLAARCPLPGESGGTLVGHRPAGLPAPLAAGPAPVRGPGRAGSLCPGLDGLPLAGSPWHGEARTPANVLRAPAAIGDWRREYGEDLARFFRGYVLDHGAGSRLFGVVRQRAAERTLRWPRADPHAVWALATLAALMSGDWLNAREPAGQAPASRART